MVIFLIFFKVQFPIIYLETASLEEWNRITISVKLFGSNFSRILRQNCIAEADMNLFDRFFCTPDTVYCTQNSHCI